MAGLITGQSTRIDRYPYGELVKVLPVDTDVMREHVQVPGDQDEDTLFGPAGKVAIATDEVESLGEVSLIQQKRKQTISESAIEDLPGSTIALSYGPVQSITAVKYLDADEVKQTLSASTYRLVGDAVFFKSSLSFHLADGPGTIWIEYIAGFGDSFESVPPQWQSLVEQVAMRRYEVREGADGTTDKHWDRMIRAQVDAASRNLRY